jgi:hypothetical protein
MTRCRNGYILTLCLAAAPAAADVTIEQTTRMEGEGLLQFMNMTMHTETSVSGDRSRTDTRMEMESRLMRMFAGAGDSSDIVRLDKDTTYRLDTENKRYTEISLAEQRAQTEKSMQEMREAQESQRQGASGVDESQCEWTDPKTEVNRTGRTETIAGFPAEELTITASQACVDKSNPEQVCEFRLSLDQWLSSEIPGGDELLEYFQAYGEKLGFEVSGSPGFAQRAESMFGSYQGIWEEVVEQMKDIDGYPVRSSFALAVGGPQCDTGAQGAGNGKNPSMSDMGKAVSGSIGGVIGGLFGGRKKQQEAEPEATAEPEEPVVQTADGFYPMMTVSSEIVSADTSAVPDGRFEVPAGYKKAN